MKKFLPVLLTAIFALCICAPAYALVAQSSDFYVADYAEVLTKETKELIINSNGELERQCKGAQFVVVTVKSLEGKDSEEYAMTLANDWGVGSAAENNGLLLLLSPEEKRGWLAVGHGIIGSFDSNAMLDQHFWPLSDAGQYNEAVTALLYSVLGWYDGHYGSNVAASITNTSQAGSVPPNAGAAGGPEAALPAPRPIPQPAPGYEVRSGGVEIFSLFFTGVVIVIMIVSISAVVRGGRRRRRWYTDDGQYYGRPSAFPIFFFGGRRRGWRPPPPPFPHDMHHHHDDHHRHDNDRWGGSGRGGGGFGHGGGGGFGGGSHGGGSGHGGGGFSGGGGGRH